MELKPCPFCGGKELNFGRFGLSISCEYCGIFFTPVGHGGKEEVIEAWNRRVDNG